MTYFDRLIGIAGTQRGYLTTADATAAGVPLVELRKMAQRGKLESVAHGLYRIAAYPHQEDDELMEAALWAGGKGIISGESAIGLWDLADVLPRKVSITVPSNYNPRKEGRDRYRIKRRNHIVIDFVDGIPVVTPEQAIMDCIEEGVSRRFVEQAIVTARRRGHFGPQTESAIRETITKRQRARA